VDENAHSNTVESIVKSLVSGLSDEMDMMSFAVTRILTEPVWGD
jgi:hypothetical protein